ncbi:MAG: bifunctional 5,10-methylenetetrahydrofolate dehydrogenase/5,10-methenyltetrahydrofolate cyclohydrolase [Syntrophomonadaceae bacterium]
MEVIDGKSLADQILSNLREANAAEGLTPCLAAIDVGENPDNKRYIGLKRKAAGAAGGITRDVILDQDTGREELLARIEGLNQDDSVDGILLQLPLPAALAAFQEEFLAAISPSKDVDGFNPYNLGNLIAGDPLYISCAARACLEVSRRYAGPLAGKKVVLVGDSFDVVLPLAVAFIKEGCRLTVIPCYESSYTQDADIAVVEKGSPLVVAPEDIKAGALLIDAGFYWHQGRTCGNVDRERMSPVSGCLLPVPGGMGPLLVAQLMINLSRAARRARKGI